MRTYSNIRSLARILAVMVSILMLGIGSLTLAQDDTEADSPSLDPVQQGLQVARDLVEEERGSALTLVRWRFYEDDWSALADARHYRAFGIDNCVGEVPILLKRADVLFGWTFILTDVSGRQYQPRVSYDLLETAMCDEIQIPPRYAGVAASVASAAAAAGPANAGPGGFVLGGHVVALDGTAIELMKRAGMTWVKKQLRLENGIDTGISLIKAAHANGFKILLGVIGDKNALASDFDGYVGRFAQFVGQLASSGADAIEVWNEPNINREWPSGQISGANYTQMLQAAYNAIKSANSGTLVISGAPAPSGGIGCSPEGMNDDMLHTGHGGGRRRPVYGLCRHPLQRRHCSAGLDKRCAGWQRRALLLVFAQHDAVVPQCLPVHAALLHGTRLPDRRRHGRSHTGRLRLGGGHYAG